MSRLIFSAAVLLVLSAPALADQVYKWKDKNGVVQFGDVPATHQAQEVDVDYNKRSDPHMENRNAKRTRMIKQYDNAQKLEQEKQKQAAAGNDASSAKCAKARKQYDSYTKAKALYAKEGGKKRMLSKDERGAAIKEVSDYLSAWCK